MCNDISIHSLLIYDKRKYLGEMFGTSAVCDVSNYVNVVRYIVHQQAISVCGEVYCLPAGRHSATE